MIGRGVINEDPVPLAEAFKLLEKQKKHGELGYEQRLAYDYAQKFAPLDVKKAMELLDGLLKIGVKKSQAVMLVDLMPETKEDIDLIFAKERTKLEEGDIAKVLELINKCRE